MKKISRFFIGTRSRATASLYLTESDASLTVRRRNGLFAREEMRRQFHADNFPKLLEEVGAFLQEKPPAGLTVVLNQSFFLERTVFLPFRKRKAVSLVLAGEIASSLPLPISEYLYDFVAPEAEHLPVTVFLLPASIFRSMESAFVNIPVKIIPSDIALSRHPSVAHSENAFLLVAGQSQARLILFRKAKFILGRSFNFDQSNYEQRLLEETKLLIRSSRFPEMEPEPVVPDERLVFGSSSGVSDFALKKADQFFLPKDTLLPYLAVGGFIILWFLFFVSLKEKHAAFISYQNVSRALEQQKKTVQVGGTSLTSVFSDKVVSLLLQKELSPLETFDKFNGSVSGDLPLALDYLQIDRQKLTMTGTLGSPEQVDSLVNKLAASGNFQEVALGELKVEGGIVRFPLTAKVAVAKNENK